MMVDSVTADECKSKSYNERDWDVPRGIRARLRWNVGYCDDDRSTLLVGSVPRKKRYPSSVQDDRFNQC